MKQANFNRRKKAKESFVSAGVEIEDIQHTKSTPSESKASIRMQVYLTHEQREWLRRKAYEEDSKMSNILRDLIDQAINAEK